MKRAVALPVVLHAIALAGALAVGGLYVTRQHVASARVAVRGAELQPHVEGALVHAVASWDSAARAIQPIGQVFELPATVSAAAHAEVWITRLGERVYWLVGQASSAGRPPIRRRIGVLVYIRNGAPALVPERSWGELP